MISKEKFLQKVQTEVFPQLLATEKDRQKALKKLFFISLGLIPCCWWLYFGFQYYKDLLRNENTRDIFTVPLVIVIVWLLVITDTVWEFKKRKKWIFSPLFLGFLGQLENNQKNITISLLKHSFLFHRFDYIQEDDCISGTFDNTEFSVAEIQLGVYGGKHDYTIFRGVCIDIPMKLSVSGYTQLYNTKIPQTTIPLQKITLEDVSFGKNYQIYSDNQIEARVLLTPAFMEKLNNLKKCFKNKRIDVSFFGNHAVFAIHTWQNLFESYSLFRKVTNLKTYAKFYDEIKSIHDMIHVLSINNKAVPIGCSFNKDLYHHISSVQEKRSDILFLSIFLGGCLLIFISTTLLTTLELGLTLSLVALVLGMTFFLVNSPTRR